jgi:hypothetical protein
MSASTSDTWIIDHFWFVIENAINDDEAFRCERHRHWAMAMVNR